MPSHRNTLPAQPRNAARNTGLASPRATPLARALAAIGVGVGVGALSVAPTYAAVVPGCAVADVYTILGNTAANNTRVLSANVYDNDSSASSCPVSGAIGTVTYGLRPNPSAATPTQGVLTWTGVPFDGGYASGAFTYKPNIGATGSDSFGYCLYDSENGVSDCANVSVSITAPTNCSAQFDNFTVNGNSTITASSGANVLTNDSTNPNVVATLSVTSFTAAANGVANVSSTGVFTYAPTGGFSGNDRVSYAIDASCAGATNTIAFVRVLPIAIDDNFSTQINTPLTSANLLLNDFVRPVRITCPSTSANGGLVSNCSTSGAFRYTPPTGFTGADSFSYSVYDDAEGVPATANVFINVVANQPPVANSDGPYTLAFGASYSGPASGATNILANDTDPESDTLTVIGNTAPGRGSVGNVASTGAFTYAPNSGISGTDSFTYTVSDGNNNNATATVAFLIRPAAVGDTYTTPFNTQLVVPLVSGVLSNDGGSGLTVLTNTTPAHGSVNVAANGTFTYTPLSTYSGADSFTYTLKDQANSNATATVNLTVGAKPNAPPVANADGPIAVAFGGTGSGNVLTNDSDADGDTLTVTGNAAPSRGSVGNVSTSGAFTYTPNVGISGVDSFSYTISDGKGGTASNVVSLIVAPRAVADTYSTPFNTPLIVPLVTGVLSNDGGSGLTVLSNTNPARGSVNVAANGTFTYTPLSTYSGADSFTYTLKDQANSNATATVNLTVGAKPNTPPVANADGPIAVAFGGTGTGNVLTNDSDADGDTLTVTGNAAPSRGSVGNVSTSGAFTYTPNVGISGADSFSYTISDGKGGTAGNVVSFIVAPKAVTDNYATPFNTPLIVPLVSSVLSNDGGTGLTILSNTNPAHGSVNVAANGTFTYTPVSTYSGADSFTYTLKDQANSNATATVNLSVGVAPISFGFVDASGSLTDTPSLGRGAVQRTIVSTAFAQPLTVKVLRSGAPVVGQLMCFSVTPAANGASATLSSATAATDANGVASVTARANTIAGSYTVVVTVCPVAASADRATLKASVSDSLVISLANDPLAIEPSVPVPSVLGWLSGLLSGLLALIGVAFTGRRRR